MFRDRELVLESGFILLAVGLAAGLGLLLFGRAVSAGQRARSHATPPPAAGTIHAERHQHISTVAAR